MPEERATYGTRCSFTDGEWEARTVIDVGPPKQVGLVIEHATPDGKNTVTLPLTPQRARALIQLLHVMLEEVGESSGVWLTGEQPAGGSALDGGSPTHRAVGFRPPKKLP